MFFGPSPGIHFFPPDSWLTALVTQAALTSWHRQGVSASGQPAATTFELPLTNHRSFNNNHLIFSIAALEQKMSSAFVENRNSVWKAACVKNQKGCSYGWSMCWRPILRQLSASHATVFNFTGNPRCGPRPGYRCIKFGIKETKLSSRCQTF